MNFQYISFTVLLLSANAIALKAQAFFDPYSLPMGQWTEKGRLFSQSGKPLRWLSKNRITEVTLPKLPDPFKNIPNFPAPISLCGIGFHLQDSLWVNGWTLKESVLFRHTGTGWEEAVRVPCTSGSRTSSLIPLRNGRYLVFNPPDPDAKHGKKNPYFYGIFALNDRGELVSCSLEPLPEKDWPLDRNLARSSGLEAAAVTEDHLTVCCPEYARFWIFSQEDGRLRHTVDLYGQETTKLLWRKHIPRLVLEFQPRKDGSLLICARDEALIRPLVEQVQKTNARLQPLLSGPLNDAQEKDLGKTLELQVTETLMPFPALSWFELNPASGSVKRLNPSPVGAQDILPVKRRAPFWLVDEDERVLYTDESFKDFLKAPEPKNASKVVKN